MREGWSGNVGAQQAYPGCDAASLRTAAMFDLDNLMPCCCWGIPSDAATDSTVRVLGGTYTCTATENGAFLFASDNAEVFIEEGLVTGCVAHRRAGVVSK